MRENIGQGEHLRTWLAALVAGAIVLFMFTAFLINIVSHYLRYL